MYPDYKHASDMIFRIMDSIHEYENDIVVATQKNRNKKKVNHFSDDLFKV